MCEDFAPSQKFESKPLSKFCFFVVSNYKKTKRRGKFAPHPVQNKVEHKLFISKLLF